MIGSEALTLAKVAPPLYMWSTATMLGWPSAPFARPVPPHPKPVTLPVVPRPFAATPAVFALTVTMAPPAVLAVTPEAFRLIASRRLFASVVVSAEVAKFANVLAPSVPAVEPVHEKPVRVLPTPIPALPFILLVTVVVLPLEVALTPAATLQALMASRRLFASVEKEPLIALPIAKLPVNGEEITVTGAAHLRCPKCHEIMLPADDARRLRQRALEIYRGKYGLLSADDIRSTRERFGLTQAELARLLRLGGNTISRWEAGRNVQTAAMDLLVRMLRDLPGSLDYLRKHAA